MRFVPLVEVLPIVAKETAWVGKSFFFAEGDGLLYLMEGGKKAINLYRVGMREVLCGRVD